MSYTVIVHRGIPPQDGELGFAFVAPLIGAAPGIFQSIMGLFNRQSATYQGLAGINAGGKKLIESLTQIRAMLQQPQLQVDPAQALSEAQRIAGALDDTTIFYPAKKGKDAAALAKFKTDASALMGEIQSLAASRMQQLQSGGTGSYGGAGSMLGMSPSTLLLVGALGLGAVYFFTNRS